MWWRPLTQREIERIEERIETLGSWLQKQGAARSVAEDLLTHEIRTLLVELRNAARHRRRGAARRVTARIEARVFELAGLLLRRKR
jgi:hypothetical protein